MIPIMTILTFSSFRESIFRNVIFLIFLIFEMMYCLSIHTLSFVNSTNPMENDTVSSINCSLHSNPTVWTSYDSKLSYMVGFILMDDFSFSMMIWLFGSSLLHLSFAARNQLKVKKSSLLHLFWNSYQFSIRNANSNSVYQHLR